jgi:hypothetical protein
LARGHETVSYAPGVRFARAFAPIAGLGFVTLLAGAFVAGNDAASPITAPLMEGRIVPEYLFVYEPAWRNWFESVPLVQLNHRLLAGLTVIAVLVLFVVSGTLSRWSGLSTEARRVLVLALIVVAGQFGLGIATLLLVVPIPLAAAHQAGALLLLTTLVWACRCVDITRRHRHPDASRVINASAAGRRVRSAPFGDLPPPSAASSGIAKIGEHDRGWHHADQRGKTIGAEPDAGQPERVIENGERMPGIRRIGTTKRQPSR